MTDRLLQIPQVAELLGVCTSTVRQLLTAGTLQGVRVGNRWRVEPRALDAYLAQARVKPAKILPRPVRVTTAPGSLSPLDYSILTRNLRGRKGRATSP